MKTLSKGERREKSLRIKHRKEILRSIFGGAETLVSDVVVPSEFVPYIVERTAELTALFQSGVIEADPAFNALASQGGQTITMPFFKDISGRSQVLSDTNALVTKKIATATDVAVINNRGDAWSVNDLAGLLSDTDPMAEIGDLVADYWARDHEATLIQQATGVFAAANMSGNQADISTAGAVTEATSLSGKTFIAAKQLLGDSAGKLTTMVIHSAVLSSLLSQDLIDFIPVSDARETITQFQGMEVIVDDNMPTGVNTNAWYKSLFFGQGAWAYGASLVDQPVTNRAEDGTWQTEFARVPLAGQNIMINRRRFILHPRGVKWIGTPAGLSPTDAEFAIGTNWTRVYDQKNVRMVMLKHNILL